MFRVIGLGSRLKSNGPQIRPSESLADRTGPSPLTHKRPVHRLIDTNACHLAVGTWDISPESNFNNSNRGSCDSIPDRTIHLRHVPFASSPSSIVPLKFHHLGSLWGSTFSISILPHSGCDTVTSIAYYQALSTIALRRHHHWPIFGDG